ncbi:MAG TPA: CU044_5270 family protein [Streptosporangiaceae bacterium]|nr:CU044_5270 family protein [Streptosporangiaceae bacterium]
MKADLAGQIHELMERGMRPVTMADIQARAPVRVTVPERARVRSRGASARLARAPGGSAASGSGRGGPRRPRRAILTAAAATAALAIAATAIAVTSLGSPGRPVFDPGAVRLLARAAAAAARQPAPHVRDGQFMYIETRAAVTSDVPRELGVKPSPFPRHPHLKLITERVWVPVGKSCGPAYKRSASANGKTAIETFTGEKCPGIGGLNDSTYRLLQALPTNPHALLALIYRVERGHGPGPDQEAFVTIGDLLRTTIAPPKVAAALYRAAALIPGVTLIPHATDAVGRHGVAVGRIGPGIDGGIRDELIFSRDTLQLLGERTVIARTGATTEATAIVARAFVDHRGQIPCPAHQTTRGCA